MMESVSNTGFKNVVAVIMTGMGRDGSEGIKKLKSVNNAYIMHRMKAHALYLVCQGSQLAPE